MRKSCTETSGEYGGRDNEREEKKWKEREREREREREKNSTCEAGSRLYDSHDCNLVAAVSGVTSSAKHQSGGTESIN